MDSVARCGVDQIAAISHGKIPARDRAALFFRQRGGVFAV